MRVFAVSSQSYSYDTPLWVSFIYYFEIIVTDMSSKLIINLKCVYLLMKTEKEKSLRPIMEIREFTCKVAAKPESDYMRSLKDN